MTTNLEKKWVWLRPTFGFGMIGVIIGFSAFNVNLDVAMFRSQRNLMKEKICRVNFWYFAYSENLCTKFYRRNILSAAVN